MYPQWKVYGGDDRIPSLTNLITSEESFKIGDLNVRPLFTPGHTKYVSFVRPLLISW